MKKVTEYASTEEDSVYNDLRLEEAANHAYVLGLKAVAEIVLTADEMSEALKKLRGRE